MATDRGFLGFEGGLRDNDLQSFSGNVVIMSDGTARSGHYFMRQQNGGATAGGYAEIVSTVTGGIALADGETARGLLRFYMKLHHYPSAADNRYGGFGTSATSWRSGLIIDTSGHIGARANTILGSYGSVVLPLGQWLQVTIEHVLQNLPASANNQLDVTITVKNEAGTTLDTATAQHITSTAINLPFPILGSSDVATTKRVDYDDVVWIIGTAADSGVSLPTQTRVAAVVATAQGASSGFTGAWQRATEIPLSGASGDEQTTTTDEATTTFAHATAAALGVSDIHAVRVLGWLKAASVGSEAIMIGSTEFTVSLGTTYSATASARDYTALTTAAFDALEFGFRNKRGVSTQVGSMWMEVLHGGPGVSQAVENATEASWRHVVGGYTGNATDREITVGFRPDVVMVKKVTGSSTGGFIRTWKMGGNTSHELNATYESTAIVGFTATGFKLGPHGDANGNTNEFVYLAIRDGGLHSSGYFMQHGVYDGDGIDNRDIVIEAGWEPDYVFVSGSTSLIYRDQTFAAGNSMRFETSATVTDEVQNINPDGFEVGTAATVNGSNTLRYYIAVRFGTQGLLDLFHAIGQDTPSGSTHTFTGMLFQPYFVMCDRAAIGDGAWRSPAATSHVGDDSTSWSSTSLLTTGQGVSAFTADGFSIGNQIAVAGQIVYWLAWLQSGEVPLDEVEFPVADVQVGLTWVELTDKANGLHLWTNHGRPLPDPADYYGGYKEDRTISWGKIQRALSDRNGQYEAASFSWLVHDLDRSVRSLLAGLSTKVFLNRPVTVRMIDDDSRRQLLVPRTMMKGILRDYRPLSPLSFQFTAKDVLAAKFSAENTKDQIPNRLITRLKFPDCPTNQINKPVPIIYGDVSDSVSASAPPVLTGTASRGAFVDGGFWAMGFGDLTSDAAIPTSPAAAAAATGTIPAGTYGIVVTAVDASNRETDPVPFFTDQGGVSAFPASVPTATVDGTQRINVTWNTSAGAAKYRVYFGVYYYGFRPHQYIEVTHPTASCAFTAAPAFLAEATPSNITPGANVVPFGFFGYYAVSAVLADGETGLSAVAFGVVRTHRRELRLEWTAVTGATEYRVYRRGPAGTWTHRWSVPSSQLFFDDDLLDTGVTFVDGAPAAVGQVPVIPVGTRADVSGFIWNAFLICGHAVKEITAVFQNGVQVDAGNFGVTFAVPGKTNYSSYFPNTGTTQYLDIGDERFTLMFIRGPQGLAAADGSQPVRVNVKGIESVGDSSGTLITDLLQQYKHAIVNFVLQNYLQGAWLTVPDFADEDLPMMDAASFDAASAVAATRISGGYIGAFILGFNGERQSIRDLVAAFNVSADVDSGFNRKTQFFVSMLDDSVAVLQTAPSISDVTDIWAATFDVEDQTQNVFNRVPYVYFKDYSGVREGGWVYSTELKDDVSISALEETKSSPEVQLQMVRNTTVAVDVIGRRLTRSKEPPRLVRLATGMNGLSFELGDVAKVTAFQGIGASGWANNPVRIMRHDTDPDRFTVTLEALDMQRLIGGAFILGAEGVQAATWPSATAADRLYGYLCDETTGLFSDNQPGRRLR